MKRKQLPARKMAGAFCMIVVSGLLGVTACGGGGSSSPTSGGGAGGGGNGGGGSQSVPPCIFNAPAAGGSTSGAGVNSQIDSHYFGMHVHSLTEPWPFFPFASQRMWDDGSAWSLVNTSSGVYDWTNMDQWLSSAQQHNVDMLYDLARTPTWASSVPTDSSCTAASQNGGGQCDPPVDLNPDGSGADDIWIGWVTAVAQHSATRKASGLTGFSYYEIWNEWNTPVYWNPQNATVAQMVRMEQDARCVVEGPPTGMNCYPESVFPSGTALDSTARIVSPAPIGSHSMLNEVALSLSQYFQTQVNGFAGGSFSDVIGFHGYVATATSPVTTAVSCPVAEDVNTVIADMNATLAAYPAITTGKPLFNTEGGWSKADDEGFTDQDEQAAFLPRYLLLQESANIGRVYWYAWDSGLLASLFNDTTGQATKAATAYQELMTWTVGATVSQACTASGTVWTCGFTRPGYGALAVWDAGQDCTASACPTTTFTVPAGGYVESRDVAGNVTSLNGATTVPIGAKPILLETGPIPAHASPLR